MLIRSRAMQRNTSILAVLTAAVLVSAGGALRAQNPVPAGPPSLLSRQPATAAAPADQPPPGAAPGAAQPGAPSAYPAAPAASNDYVLSPSDTVEMSVFHEPDLLTQTRISGDGSAQFPLIGEVKLAGMALRDARETIRKKYNADYIVEPQVYLNVIAYAKRTFSVIGQVNKPATYDMAGGEHPSLLEAIAMAGGFTRVANQKEVIVKRPKGGGEEVTMKVNVQKLTDANGKPYQLTAGDVINVRESWY